MHDPWNESVVDANFFGLSYDLFFYADSFTGQHTIFDPLMVLWPGPVSSITVEKARPMLCVPCPPVSLLPASLTETFCFKHGSRPKPTPQQHWLSACNPREAAITLCAQDPAPKLPHIHFKKQYSVVFWPSWHLAPKPWGCSGRTVHDREAVPSP